MNADLDLRARYLATAMATIAAELRRRPGIPAGDALLTYTDHLSVEAAKLADELGSAGEGICPPLVNGNVVQFRRAR